MGVVYVGTQALMGRPVVLKVMTPAAHGYDGAAERFLREIRTAAGLDHPNVVKAYAAHQAGGRLVFVMEYVPGDDLAKLVADRGPLPVANACSYAYQAALGLQHAHERGTVHRDIKPGNLILAKVGNRSVVKVTDFGLAKAAREREADGGLTGDGRLMGTPHFIAPEQAMDAARADIRADVYSLGCTLYFLLAGRPPFDGGSLMAIIDAHRHTEPQPLDAVRPDVSPALAAVVARFMAKDPARRPATPGEAARALLPFFKPAALSDPHRGTDANKPLTIETPRLARPVTPPTPVAIIRPDHWKPPTVFRGHAVPTDTAYLNAEDFNPPAKPPKSPRKRKPKPWEEPVLRMAVLGCVLVTTALLGGLNAAGVIRLKAPPVEVLAKAGAGEPPVGPPADGWVPLFNGRDSAGWHADPLNKGDWSARADALRLAGGPTPDDRTSEFPVALVVSDRTDFRDVRLRVTYKRSTPAAFCTLVVRTTGGGKAADGRSTYFNGGCTVSLGGATGGGQPRPLGSLLVAPKSGKANWTSAPDSNPDGVTTLEVEVAGDTVRTFAADGTQLLAAHLGDQPAGAIGLWASSGSGLEVLKLEVKELPPPPRPVGPAAPLVFGDRAPELPVRHRLSLNEFGVDDPGLDERQHGTRAGHYVITGGKAKGTGWNLMSLRWDAAIPNDGDFAVEGVGRVRGGPAAKWGLHLTYHSKSVTEYSVFVRLSADGEAAVMPGYFAKPRLGPEPLAAPTRHPAVRTGAEYNRLLAVHRGRELRVYCNGALVAGPVTLPADLLPPMTVSFTAEGADTAELDRLTTYSLDPPGR